MCKLCLIKQLANNPQVTKLANEVMEVIDELNMIIQEGHPPEHILQRQAAVIEKIQIDRNLNEAPNSLQELVTRLNMLFGNENVKIVQIDVEPKKKDLH